MVVPKTPPRNDGLRLGEVTTTSTWSSVWRLSRRVLCCLDLGRWVGVVHGRDARRLE